MATDRWRPFGASLERWEPYRMSDIQTEVNRLFDTFFGRPAPSATHAARTWAPFVDMQETKDDLVLRLDLPGISEKDVTVSIMGDLLTVRGERRAEHEGEGQNYLHVERVYGKFERAVQLPMAVQADKVRASYRDGVLEIKLPKTEEVKPREIKIDIQ
jgi:HSP20 family protein